MVALSVSTYADPGAAADRGPAYRLAFVYDDPGLVNDALYVMDGDGTHRRTVNEGFAVIYDLDWSPTGERVVFAGETNRSGLFVVNVDGTGLRRLTRNRHCGEADTDPHWSSNGWIVFRHDTCEGMWIHAVRPSGDRNHLLIDHKAYNPVWSPDGRYVGFNQMNSNFLTNVFSAEASGDAVRQLTRTGPDGGDPSNYVGSFSPDGESIAYSRYDTEGRHRVSDICVVGSRTESPPPSSLPVQPPLLTATEQACQGELLTPDTQHDNDPEWSPDGRRILFISGRDGNDELYSMRADGSDQRRLTTSRGAEAGQSWSPDGRWIEFTRRRHGQLDLFVMRRDGTDLRRLTRTTGNEYQAEWSPVP
jgi:TolB protein